MKKIRRWLISHGWAVVLAATIGYLMGQYLPGVPGSLENRVGAIESRLGVQAPSRSSSFGLPSNSQRIRVLELQAEEARDRESLERLFDYGD